MELNPHGLVGSWLERILVIDGTLSLHLHTVIGPGKQRSNPNQTPEALELDFRADFERQQSFVKAVVEVRD